MGEDAGRTIGDGVDALKTPDRVLAEAIIAHDADINRVRYDVEEHGELDVRRHAMYCPWKIDQGKMHAPPSWLDASLKDEWSAPHGMPSDWLPTVLLFRVDENTFVEFAREIREDKKAT